MSGIYPVRGEASNGTGIRFGTSGWRGIIGDDFTLENFSIVVQAIVNYLKRAGDTKPGIIVGYDTRFMSDRFAKISAGILGKNNIPVFLTNRDTPTPAIAFHILKKHTLGAINITASHNPPQYNGIKFSTSYGGPAPVEVTKEIENGVRPHFVEAKWGLTPFSTFDPRPAYLRHICNIIDLDAIKKSKIKIAIDCMYGTVRGYLDYILKDATVLHDVLNPNFGGSSPDPSVERLKELKDTKAHLGLATDGDADRFGIIDRDGSFIPTNYVLVLIFEHLLKTRKHKGGIVRSMPTTHLLDAIARKFEREVFEVPVGFKYVGTTLLEKDAIMGCEESGGMTIFGHIPEKDGILACLLVAEIVAYNKKPLKELLEGIWNKYGRFYSKRIDIRLKPEDKDELLNKIRNSPLKKFTDGSWVMIRPSGTEPVIRCYVESPSLKKIPTLVNELKRWIQK